MEAFHGQLAVGSWRLAVERIEIPTIQDDCRRPSSLLSGRRFTLLPTANCLLPTRTLPPLSAPEMQFVTRRCNSCFGGKNGRSRVVFHGNKEIHPMKKTITAVAVLALSASLAIAAPGEGKAGKHGRHGRAAHGERGFAKLNLSDAQKAQVKQLREQFRNENKALFDGMKQTRTEMKAAREANDTARLEALRGTATSQREQLKAKSQALNAQVLNLLTAEQRAQYDAMKAEREARRAARGERGERGRGHRGQQPQSQR
jgi:protein CpxP